MLEGGFSFFFLPYFTTGLFPVMQQPGMELGSYTAVLSDFLFLLAIRGFPPQIGKSGFVRLLYFGMF